MAIGLGKVFGFHFNINFNYPYISKSLTEFWRRWHISLSSWFKDYVYIPLGGNRKGKGRTYLNLIIVFALTGFWHGASWTFIFWGLWHGLFILLEKLFKNFFEKIPSIILHIYLLLVVSIGWVFFRADNFTLGYKYLKNMFTLHPDISLARFIYYCDFKLILILLLATLISTPIFKKLTSMKYLSEIMAIFILIISFAFLANYTYNPFLYWRF